MRNHPNPLVTLSLLIAAAVIMLAGVELIGQRHSNPPVDEPLLTLQGIKPNPMEWEQLPFDPPAPEPSVAPFFRLNDEGPTVIINNKKSNGKHTHTNKRS